MENLKIGEDPLEINSLVRLIEKSPSHSKLLQHWKRLGRNLGVNETKLLDLSRQLGIGTTELHDIPHELLSSWRADKGSDATLDILCDALANCQISDISDLLEREFWLVAIKSLRIKLHDTEIVLGKVTENTPNDTLQEIYDALKKSNYVQPIPLLKEDAIPKVGSYYIRRTLCCMTEVDEGIFKSDIVKSHLFLVKGTNKHKLAKLSGYQPVDMSGNQLDEITVRFMVLEHDEDFKRICEMTNDPVHFIECQNDSFFWVKSIKGLDAIQRFMKKRKLTEEILNTSHFPAISIADSPGMGKSFLLANLASKFKKNNDCIVIFMVFNEFFKYFQDPIDSPSATLEAITTYASASEVSRLVLEELMRNSDKYTVDLFLDGYDEVARLNKVDEFLMHLKKLPNFRIFVTTRPHFRPRLEDLLNVLSYEILAFNQSNQIEFLAKYWVDKLQVNESERLQNYAKECLKTLHDQMTDMEWEIAGIPLQCRMLAEVYAEDARRALKLNSGSPSAIKITSLFDMYKRLVDMKFGRLPEASKQNPENSKSKYLNFHVLNSIVLLFPEWVNRLRPRLSGFQKMDENVLYSIGLLEKSPYLNTPRFVHRTFAEYLLAEFLVTHEYGECVEMIFGDVIVGKGVEKGERRSEYSVKHPVMAYFINMHLKEKVQLNPLDELALSVSKHRNKIKFEDLCKAVAACGSQDFETTFELSMELFKHLNLDKDSYYVTFLRDRYFKLLPHFTVCTYKNVSLVRKVVDFTQNIFGVDLSYHIFKTILASASYPWIPGCTPLHVAVYYGKYNIVTYMVQEYGDKIKDLKYLFHVCVHDSSDNNDLVIDDKLSILDVLADKSKEHNVNWLEETFENRTPLMEKNVHFKDS